MFVMHGSDQILVRSCIFRKPRLHDVGITNHTAAIRFIPVVSDATGQQILKVILTIMGGFTNAKSIAHSNGSLPWTGKKIIFRVAPRWYKQLGQVDNDFSHGHDLQLVEPEGGDIDNGLFDYTCPECDYTRRAHISVFRYNTLAKPLWCGTCRTIYAMRLRTCSCGLPWYNCPTHGVPSKTIIQKVTRTKPSHFFTSDHEEEAALKRLERRKRVSNYGQAHSIQARRALTISWNIDTKYKVIKLLNVSTATCEARNKRRKRADHILVGKPHGNGETSKKRKSCLNTDTERYGQGAKEHKVLSMPHVITEPLATITERSSSSTDAPVFQIHEPTVLFNIGDTADDGKFNSDCIRTDSTVLENKPDIIEHKLDSDRNSVKPIVLSLVSSTVFDNKGNGIKVSLPDSGQISHKVKPQEQTSTNEVTHVDVNREAIVPHGATLTAPHSNAEVQPHISNIDSAIANVVVNHLQAVAPVATCHSTTKRNCEDAMGSNPKRINMGVSIKRASLARSTLGSSYGGACSPDASAGGPGVCVGPVGGALVSEGRGNPTPSSSCVTGTPHMI